MAGILGLPPGLRGWVAADQLNQQRQQNDLGQMQGILGMQNSMLQQQKMRQEMSPEMQQLRTDLLKAQIAKALRGKEVDPVKAAELASKLEGLQQFQTLVSKGGNWGPNTGTPSVVTPNQGGEEEALRQVMEAEAQGRPANVAAPTAGNLMAAAAKAGKPPMATPFMPQQGKNTAVAGGYVNEKGQFVRTQTEKDPTAGKVAFDPTTKKWRLIKADGSFGPEAGPPGASEEGQRNRGIGSFEVKQAQDLNEYRDEAEAAQRGKVKMNRLLTALETADFSSGFGAEFFNDLNRMRAQFLKDKPATDKASMTQYINALMGQQVFPAIKELGIGARGLDTPAEREFLRDVMMGTIKLEKGTLIQLAKDKVEASDQIIKRYNDKIDRGDYDRFYRDDPKTRKIPIGDEAKNDTKSVEDWISRAMKRNMVSRSKAIEEGKKIGKVPKDYKE